MKKILVILGHPNHKSYCSALAESYIRGARREKAHVTYVKLGDVTFDVLGTQQNGKSLEPSLQKIQKLIKDSDHIVVVYPTWWGSAPALLKGLFDRVLTSGFAFKYRTDGLGWNKLLKGRSARIITTTGGPWILNHLVYRAAGIKALKWATFWFCGIWPVRVTEFSSLNTKWSNERKRKKYLACVERIGEKDARR